MPVPISAPVAVHLKDYAPPPYQVGEVHLDVDIRVGMTEVVATMACLRDPSVNSSVPLALDGEDLETLSVSIDGRELSAGEYSLSANRLMIRDVPARFELQTRVRICPEKNTQLSGLYRSRDGYVTQCEPQGFRRITWFIDRPDVMAPYRVTLHADKAKCPVLLANGNPVGQGDEPGGRHYAIWEDPFRKPCYLFAMVAGKLDVLRDTYTTASGRVVQLAIYVEPGKRDQCAHAMAALKKSMRWDEATFGLECDLDHYMIVAVGDFNMGAMENKGLNIFNTKYVLARHDVATDADFENVDRVVAHEYFHNWTGNRVTCRDWFQLSLKEGLTVFRDQEFGADTHGRETARIREVRLLRAAQFPEDAGPMAHPVRPETYLEINNFYTATVYEKGAEVVRMIRTLIGEAAFGRGMQRYISRHDGQAVTCDEFVAAMAEASGKDLSVFMNWYRQPGTPKLKAQGDYQASARRYVLTLELVGYTGVSRPDADAQLPLLIPVAVGLVGSDGGDFELGGGLKTQVLALTGTKKTFVFEQIPEAPVPSLLRDFSAPVILDVDYTDAELAHLLAHDSDAFNRWEAGQRLFGRLLLGATGALSRGEAVIWPEGVFEAARRVLCGSGNPAFIAEALSLPGESTLAEQMETVDPEGLHQARNSLLKAIAGHLESEFRRLYEALTPTSPYSTQASSVARRRLRNLCLAYLNELDAVAYRALAVAQFEGADNMTDQFAALSVLVNALGSEGEGEKALAKFYGRWQHEALVVDKWLAVQAGSRRPGTQACVERLVDSPAFDRNNPNKVYALLRTFGANHVHFHAADGSGYRFLAGQIALLDAINPQVASRLARSFDQWQRFDAGRQQSARQALLGLRDGMGCSADLQEVLEKALAGYVL